MDGIGSGPDTQQTVNRANRTDQLARAKPGEADAAKVSAPQADPVKLAKDNEVRAEEARKAGVAPPKAADANPPLPRPRPDNSPDIKVNPRKPMAQGAGMGQQRSESKDVKTMQNRLQDLGYSVGHQVSDGKFGPKTELGVKDFQKANGLPETGKLDKATWDKMRSREAVKREVNNDPVAGTMLEPQKVPGSDRVWDDIAKKLKAGAYK